MNSRDGTALTSDQQAMSVPQYPSHVEVAVR